MLLLLLFRVTASSSGPARLPPAPRHASLFSLHLQRPHYVPVVECLPYFTLWDNPDIAYITVLMTSAILQGKVLLIVAS